MSKHKVVIQWGSTLASIDVEPCEYEFDTEAELAAFLHGVDEAAGWLDYEVVEPSGLSQWVEEHRATLNEIDRLLEERKAPAKKPEEENEYLPGQTGLGSPIV